MLLIFIPISFFIDISFLFTKLNGGIPTFFNTCVIESTIYDESLNVQIGDKLLFTKKSEGFSKNQLVAYYQPTNEENETGSPIRVGVIKAISTDEDGNLVYGISGQAITEGKSYFIIEKAIIGVYKSNSAFSAGVISFLSSKATLATLSLIPSSVILILLVLDAIELNNIRRINKEINKLSN